MMENIGLPVFTALLFHKISCRWSGKVVMTQMLQRGDTYRVPDRDGLVVIARDGGLLSYVIDGKEKGVLGAPGEILTGKSIDLKDLAAKG